MLTRIYWIERKGNGALAMMPRPRGGEFLLEEILALEKAGVNIVVSLLTEREQYETELSTESKVCEEHGIKFLSFPIEDRQLPRRTDDFLKLIRFLSDRLHEGLKIVVHCRMGIGRSALIVAGILVLEGYSPAEAFESINKARGCPVPDTEEQRVWLYDFAWRYRDMENAKRLLKQE